MMNIIIYGKAGDAHTVAFKNYMRMSDIPFEYKDINKDAEARAHTKELYDGRIKVPTLIVNDEIHKTPTSDQFNTIMQNSQIKE